MSRLSQFMLGAAGRSPISIVNGFEAGGKSIVCNYLSSATKEILSGVLTAGTYKELLSVSGAGVISLLCGVTLDTTSRTLGLKLVVDGITAFDAVSETITTTLKGIPIVGFFPGATISATYKQISFIPFHSSFAVSLKSSLTETDKLKMHIIYHLV
jgi:hypothetical protein